MKPGPLPYKNTLFTSDDDIPPKYKTDSGILFFFFGSSLFTQVHFLADITVNLRHLPHSAWKKCNNGQYYQATYQLGLIFGPELTLKVMYEGKVLGAANALYS